MKKQVRLTFLPQPKPTSEQAFFIPSPPSPIARNNLPGVPKVLPPSPPEGRERRGRRGQWQSLSLSFPPPFMVPSSYRHFFLSRYKKSIAVAASLTHSLPSYIVLPLLPPPSSLSEAIQKIHQKPFSLLCFEVTIASHRVFDFFVVF